MVRPPAYVTASDERKLLGVSLLLVAFAITVVTCCCGCIGFVIFLLGVSGVLLLFLPSHKNLMHLEGRSVFITGCDTGFGHGLAKRLASMGCTVFAGCLNPDGDGAKKLKEEGSDKLHVIALDVTKCDSVQKAVNYIESTTGELWAVVNNAGINYLGDIELVDMELFKRVTEVNLHGVVRVTKACLKLLRQSQGRVVNVTSVKGLLAFPICGHYCASKFGVEAFSDALRLEMRPWGVHVVLVEPCNFGGATTALTLAERDYNEIWSRVDASVQSEYGREYVDRQIEGARASAQTTHPSIDPVLAALVEAVSSSNPQFRYNVGGSNQFYDFYKWLGLLRPFIPTCLMDWYILYLFNLPTPAALQPPNKKD